MTGFTEPNGGVDYATNDVLPAATVNTVVDNERVAFERSLSQWRVFESCPATADHTDIRIPSYYEPWSSIICVASGAATDPSLYSFTPSVSTYKRDWVELVNYSALTGGEQYVSQGMSTGSILMVNCSANETLWYVGQTGGATLSSHAFSGTDSIIAGGPILETVDSLGAVQFIVPGRNGSDNPSVTIFPNGGASCTVEDYAGAGQLMRRAASDDSGTIAVVGGSGAGRLIALSGNYGTSWTWSAYPTLTGGSTTAEPSVAYDAGRELFVTTMLDTDGKIVYCSSPDGSSWGDWHRIPSSVGGTTTATTLDSADVVVIGGTWIVCRPYAPALTASLIMQVFASHDGGASWFDITPLPTIPATDGAWMVQLGNRVGLMTNDWFALSEEFDVGTGTASEAV